jgi:hypothetical protein
MIAIGSGWGRRAGVLALGVAGGLAAATRVGRRQFDARIQRQAGELIAAAKPPGSRFDPADLASLPAPIQRYIERVLPAGQRPIERGRLRQDGEFRLDSAWHPLTAIEWFTTRPPGFVWDATIDVAPLLPVRVFDAYHDGEGRLEARLLSTLPLASAGPSPEMNEGELVRYLAEAVWYPTALLPGAGVTWESIDGSAARAMLADGDVSASVVFHVDAADRIDRVTAERYRQETDDHAPWAGTYDAYETYEGIEIPTKAAVAWQDGDQPYWRATVEPQGYVIADAGEDAA